MEEKLIIAVAGFPIIYDITLFSYRDQLQKNEAWDKIAGIVGVSAEDCKKKWKSLRDMFRKERKKEKDRRRSGAGASSARPWRYIAVMGFLNPFMEDRPTSSNMGGGEALDDSGQRTVIMPWPGTVRHQSRRQSFRYKSSHQSFRHKSRYQSFRHQTTHQCREQASPPQEGRDPTPLTFEERLITVLEAVSNRPGPVPSPSPPPPPPPDDSDSYFFKSLQEDFRTQPLRTRQDLKFEMHRLVYEAKCCEVDPWAERNGVQLTTL